MSHSQAAAVISCGKIERNLQDGHRETPNQRRSGWHRAQSLSKNFDQTGNSSGFIFDVSLSTAIAADGKIEAQAPVPKGPLSPEMLDRVNRLLAGC